MKYTKKLFLFTLAILFGSLLFGNEVSAATLYVNPQDQTVSADDTFFVNIYFDSEKELINAIAGEISFSQDLLEVVDISYGDSFLTIWPEEPTFDNDNGLIKFTGGIPGGSYIFDSKLLTITYKALRIGNATVRFNKNNSSAHLNNGEGTPANLETIEGNININTPSSQEIEISSPTHPNQDEWYSENDFTVEWEPRIDAFYSYIISTDPNSEPDKIQEIEIGKVDFQDLSDGIHYFVLFEKQSGEDWQFIGKRRVKIDQTPPLPFEIESIKNTKEFENGAIIFSTTDEMSGIDYYDLMEGEKLFSNVSSPYKYQINDLTYFLVTAYDKAGNAAEAKIIIKPENEKSSSIFGIIVIVIIGILIIIAIIILWLKSKNEKDSNSE